MDRSSTITLIKETYTKDDIGQSVPQEVKRTVFCQIESISRQEFANAGALGLKPELRADIFFPEYEGEKIAEVDGYRYSIYRVYRTKNEKLELYMERQGGTVDEQEYID